MQCQFESAQKAKLSVVVPNFVHFDFNFCVSYLRGIQVMKLKYCIAGSDQRLQTCQRNPRFEASKVSKGRLLPLLPGKVLPGPRPLRRCNSMVPEGKQGPERVASIPPRGSLGDDVVSLLQVVSKNP